ncbi:GNAT family N-acetyltransferase [Muricauda sp. AC10]|nr:GNAT family N-acetyltransferase [Muricauda sp. AC10]
MKNEVSLKPVNSSNMDIYIQVGRISYVEHYLHLWENEDPTPYLSTSFTQEVVQKELEDPNAQNYLVEWNDTVVGIVKLVKDRSLDEFTAEESLLAQKIYLLKAYSGKGIGKKVLQLIESYAQGLNKKIVWLDTMQKGNPIHFYQKNGYEIKRAGEVKLPGAKPEEKPMWILTKQI